ncbi:MAG TPA: hypothetical protein VHE80_00500 [Acidimicrobiales bacterium]|nr:hypothetical protein [Acidimicrobiales bacterium]
MRRLALALGLVVLASSGTYVFVYLYRWEWNRAMFAAALFIATEVAMLAVVVMRRLSALASGLEELRRRPVDPLVLARLQESAPAKRDHFAWMSPRRDDLSVFVPVLMGAGVVLSGLAWIVERLAGSTARSVFETGLAGKLSRLSLPEDGLVGEADHPLALLAGPHGSP